MIARAHIENLYDVPVEVGHAVWDLTALVARTMKQAYGCEGISTRQHNEPAGNQDAWHLHVQVFPRHPDDQLYARHVEAAYVDSTTREPYAERLAAELALPRTFTP